MFYIINRIGHFPYHNFISPLKFFFNNGLFQLIILGSIFSINLIIDPKIDPNYYSNFDIYFKNIILGKYNYYDSYKYITFIFSSFFAFFLLFYFFAIVLVLAYYYSFLKGENNIYSISKYYWIFIIPAMFFNKIYTLDNPESYLLLYLINFSIFFLIVSKLNRYLLHFKKLYKESFLFNLNLKLNIFIIFNSGYIDSKYYIIGINKNLKSWLYLSPFIFINNKGVYIYKNFYSFETIEYFNNVYSKKLTDYNKDEFNTLNMFSFK